MWSIDKKRLRVRCKTKYALSFDVTQTFVGIRGRFCQDIRSFSCSISEEYLGTELRIVRDTLRT